ncbi:hypothetical protein [Pseudoxanthomonas wuyuanensis]
MSKLAGNFVMAMVLLLGVPGIALFAYDAVAVRPHLSRIETVLAQANPEDAFPPEIIRDLIDANAGSPTPHAARLVILLVHAEPGQRQSHLRNALWAVLLPMHFDKSQMYGLYAVLSYNGTDYGLSNFAGREYGKPLSRLSSLQAATTVAVTHAPSAYLRSRGRLDMRARVLLEKYRHAAP